MLDHVSLGVTNIERSRRFYDATLRPLGLVRIVLTIKRPAHLLNLCGMAHGRLSSSPLTAPRQRHHPRPELRIPNQKVFLGREHPLACPA